MIRKITILITRFLFLLLYKHKTYGRENLISGRGIVAPNHTSFLDPPMVGSSYPDVVHFLARDSLFSFRPFGWYLGKLLTHPIAKGKGNLQSFKLACEMIDAERKIVIFPEGRRSMDGELLEGKLGIGMLVLRTEAPVIPAYIHGTYAIWPPARKWPKLRGHTAIVFGKPLFFDKYFNSTDRKGAQQKIVVEIMEAIRLLKEWYEAGHLGSPP